MIYILEGVTGLISGMVYILEWIVFVSSDFERFYYHTLVPCRAIEGKFFVFSVDIKFYWLVVAADSIWSDGYDSEPDISFYMLFNVIC